jgi:hypothetical protein
LDQGVKKSLEIARILREVLPPSSEPDAPTDPDNAAEPDAAADPQIAADTEPPP